MSCKHYMERKGQKRGQRWLIRWEIVCPSYTIGNLPDFQTAERRLAEVLKLGACHEQHQIRPVEKRV